AALRDLGIEDGERAAILSLNSDRYHEFLAATLGAGGVVVPVNLRWSIGEIAESLAEVGARVLVVDDAFAGHVAGIRAAHPGLDVVIHAGDSPSPSGEASLEALIAEHEPVEDAYRGGGDLAAVFYTGGTTGRSKGVMLSHGNLLTSALGVLASEHFLSPDGVYLHAAPMFHLADLAAWTCQLVRGGTHAMIPMFEPVAVMTAIAEQGITDVLLVPTMIQLLVDHPRIDEFDLSGLRGIIYGASPMSEGVLNRAVKALPNTTFTQAYGMTELSPCATLLLPADHEHPVHRRAAGRAVLHGEVRIVGPDDVEVPRGTVGEIVARGGHVMQGYWNRPEETAQALRGGWMHTGDSGYMDDDGFVYIADRIKDMIITGGENVYSVEVENVLAQHPAVATCAVIGVPDERWGERVHAVVVPVAGGTVTIEELTAFCHERLAGYKTPKSMEIADGLPLSAAGKVLKRELRKPYWEDQERAVH
ncbi:MAG TPA: AMP-binding protein, partial [Blastococcus sp.]|nr:AMP-binding protein [Blastococcus sp.]